MEGLYPRATALIEEMGHRPGLIRWVSPPQLIDDDNSRCAVNFVHMVKLVQIRYAKYATVSLAYKVNPWPDFPADMVLPAGTQTSINRLVLNSRRLPGSVPKDGELVTIYFTSPFLDSMSDEDIRRKSIEATHRVFGVAPEPDFVQLFVCPRGISISSPGTYAKMDSVHDELPPGIPLAGDYFANN